jgi:hypothetical protein
MRKYLSIVHRVLLLFVCILLLPCAAGAAGFEITPFKAVNQSPLIQIYGLPRDSGTDIVAPGTFHIQLNQDLASNYTVNRTAGEQITLDGETYRVAFAARYGLSPKSEIGVEIPYIIHGSGFLDSFIIGWHNTFGLPQGGRDAAPKNRMNFSYQKDGDQKLLLNRSAAGIGDISLTGGFTLYDTHAAERHDTVALKAAVKLPTGDSSLLLGSGSTDVALQFCGSMNSSGNAGALGVYGSIGGVVMSESEVLRDQHNRLAGVGSVGVGWGPTSWIAFKVQLNGTTPLYHDSALTEFSKSPLLLILGGTLVFPGNYLLDIAVSEDVAVDTAPDVGFHLGLSTRF